jgi:alpha/beta superfamily hydrolase
MTFQPPMPQPVNIDGPCGLLQAIVEEPIGAAPPAIAVVCHPHPLQGGTMTNKVVHTLARACNEVGAPTVRFNYRGVGASEGNYDDGVGETEDALAVIEWARARWPATTLWLAGFSFGGGVALRASVRTNTTRLITVAPAAARAGTQAVPDCPWLLVQGDADDVVPAEMVLDWAKTLRVTPDIRVLTGAGHFFHGRLIELREVVRDWLQTG